MRSKMDEGLEENPDEDDLEMEIDSLGLDLD